MFTIPVQHDCTDLVPALAKTQPGELPRRGLGHVVYTICTRLHCSTDCMACRRRGRYLHGPGKPSLYGAHLLRRRAPTEQRADRGIAAAQLALRRSSSHHSSGHVGAMLTIIHELCPPAISARQYVMLSALYAIAHPSVRPSDVCPSLVPGTAVVSRRRRR